MIGLVVINHDLKKQKLHMKKGSEASRASDVVRGVIWLGIVLPMIPEI
jgi:hypothetical protein